MVHYVYSDSVLVSCTIMSHLVTCLAKVLSNNEDSDTRPFISDFVKEMNFTLNSK